MSRRPRPLFHSARSRSFALLLAGTALLASCKQAPQTVDPGPSDQMAMWLDSVPQLKDYGVTNAEIEELSKAHQAGLTDPASVALIQAARERKTEFADGQAVADLLNARVGEQTILDLARLNQLGPWAGEARAIRLAGLSDRVILAVAQRRSRGLAVMSGEMLGELKNTGASDAAILEMVQRGDSDETAAKYVAAHNRAAGHSFVYQGRKKSG